MKCKRKYDPKFENQLNKIKKRDKTFYKRLEKKIENILEKPHLSKPSRMEFKGLNHVDMGSKVLFFLSKPCEVTFYSIIFHDDAFRD